VPELRKWLDKHERSDRYTSHDPQDEILQLAASSILRDIVSEIKSGKCRWFSLIADEYSDIANKEQLSINVRWIDDKMEPHEDFLGFYEIPNIKAETIDKALKDALIRSQLSIRDLRGRDNATTEQATCSEKRQEWQEGYRKFSQRHLTHIVTAIPLVLALKIPQKTVLY